jgi:steroid delta-isomerase-like uncharacterized protein
MGLVGRRAATKGGTVGIEVVEQYERAWADKNMTAMPGLYTDGGFYRGAGTDEIRGEDIAEYASLYAKSFPDYQYEWTVLAASDDAVAVEWVFSGTMTGELAGIAPTGGSCSVRGAHLIRLSGDKMASVEAFWDNLDFYQQLGIKVDA